MYLFICLFIYLFTLVVEIRVQTNDTDKKRLALVFVYESRDWSQRCNTGRINESPSLSLGQYRLEWNDVTVIYGHDTISMLYDMMSYFAKLTGENLSRYLHKASP